MKKKIEKISIYSDEELTKSCKKQDNLKESLMNSDIEDEELEELSDWGYVTSSTTDTGLYVSLKNNWFKQLWPFFKVILFS